VVVVLASALGLWLFAPTLSSYRLQLQNLARQDRGEMLVVPQSELGRRRMLDASEWLRQSTPPTSGYLSEAGAPEYGVLAPWGYGHLLKYAAQRPTTVGNFGDDVGERNLRRVEAYLRSAESDAVGVLRDLNVRYVVVETLAASGAGLLGRNTMRSRLSLDDSPGLEHHRLLWESPLATGADALPRSELRIFEFVPGALVEGAAAPGAQVRAALRYVSNRGRNGVFETAVYADESGRYRMRLPYATVAGPPGVATDPAYLIGSVGHSARLAIDEAAVQNGLTIAGPRFEAE
jgi:dolichyl-diphosphooligosaccharide--protein glycosyltransferase